MKNLLLVLSAVFMIMSCQQNATPCIPQDKQIEANIRRRLKNMTLEEKIGQMTQVTATILVDKDSRLTPEAETLLRKYKVGSVLNPPVRIGTPPAEISAFVKQINDIIIDETGIPCLYGLDHIHGTSFILGGVLFPQEINLAATFSRELGEIMGKITGYESRAANVPWSFSPTMDISRNPLWPRFWESCGEDVYVNAEMAKAITRGLQGEDPNHIGPHNIAACAKHFMGYGVAVSGADRTPSSIAASELREKHFEPFKEVLQEGILTLMVNSSSNNGVPFHCNAELHTKWLKEDLNWDGMIVTDWADINNLYTRERVASSKKEAVKMAINAGIDMSMVPLDFEFCDELKVLVEEGEVPMSRIDDAVSRILRVKYRLGLFDTPDTKTEDYPEFASAEHKNAAYRTAVESEVLLKNEGVLPLKKSARILVTGPNANSMRTLNGGWSYTWQGDVAERPEFTAQYNTVYEALANKFDHVRYVPGIEYDLFTRDWQYEKVDIAPVVRAAKDADVIVVCVGENTYCETPGNITDLNLSDNQQELVKACAATGKPVVMILNEGRPRVIREIEPLADAIVDIMLPGNFGADALASLLCGDENFSAKLPFTYPKYVNKFAVYDYKPAENQKTMAGDYNYNAVMDVQWPFGHGLSYTTFEYSNMTVDKAEFTPEDVLTVTIDVKNTGKVAGKESVLLFSTDMYATCTPDVRRLREFTKVELAPGETKTVTFTLPATELAFADYYGRWTIEEGDFALSCGGQSVMTHCTQTIVYETPNID